MLRAMSTAGYSGTPLPRKLGIRDGSRVLLFGAPRGFAETLGELPAGAELLAAAANDLDVVVVFVLDLASLRAHFAPRSQRHSNPPAGSGWRGRSAAPGSPRS
jgi:hypothetical protein